MATPIRTKFRLYIYAFDFTRQRTVDSTPLCPARSLSVLNKYKNLSLKNYTITREDAKLKLCH